MCGFSFFFTKNSHINLLSNAGLFVGYFIDLGLAVLGIATDSWHCSSYKIVLFTKIRVVYYENPRLWNIPSLTVRLQTKN